LKDYTFLYHILILQFATLQLLKRVNSIRNWQIRLKSGTR